MAVKDLARGGGERQVPSGQLEAADGRSIQKHK